jgi:hypothetical protein
MHGAIEPRPGDHNPAGFEQRTGSVQAANSTIHSLPLQATACFLRAPRASRRSLKGWPSPKEMFGATSSGLYPADHRGEVGTKTGTAVPRRIGLVPVSATRVIYR